MKVPQQRWQGDVDDVHVEHRHERTHHRDRGHGDHPGIERLSNPNSIASLGGRGAAAHPASHLFVETTGGINWLTPIAGTITERHPSRRDVDSIEQSDALPSRGADSEFDTPQFSSRRSLRPRWASRTEMVVWCSFTDQIPSD